MRITIAQRLRPYMLSFGERCPIPGTSLCVRAFPAFLVIEDLSSLNPKEVAAHEMNIRGPVKDFTVQLDLEKGCVRVWGHAQNGYFRYHISQGVGGYAIVVEKSLDEMKITNFSTPVYPDVPQERLSLGVDKKQDWCSVSRRIDMGEILPFWLRLGSMAPPAASSRNGTASLLTPEKLSLLFLTGFEGVMSPRLFDGTRQGIPMPSPQEGDNPGCLLAEGAKVIRSLFFQHQERTFRILPEIPHAFHSGRYIHADCGACGEMDFEWRSHKLRRLIFRCRQNGDYTFVFPKALKTFRFREQCNVKGVVAHNGRPLDLREGITYYMDRFEG